MTDFWVVAQTRALCERRVINDLQRKDHESYCPFVQRKRFRKGKKILTAHAMFPGYVFVRIKNCWYDIFSASLDVIKLLTTSDNIPAKVHDELVHKLKSLEGKDGVIKLPLPPLYQRGQKVKVKAGQFSGFLGFYEGPGSRQTEKVIVQLLGRWVPIHVGIDDLVSSNG